MGLFFHSLNNDDDYDYERLRRDDLFVFDGCPEKIDNLKVEYNRETKIKPKQLPEDAEYEFVTWNYSEVLTIDRATETLTNHIQFAEQCSVTNTYHVEEGISSLLDDLWPEMFDDITGNPPAAGVNMRRFSKGNGFWKTDPTTYQG